MFLKAKIMKFLMKFRSTSPRNNAPEVDLNGNNNFEDEEEELEEVFDYAEGDDEVRFDDFDGKTIHFLCKLSLEIPKCQHVILPGLFLFVIQHECTRLIYFYSNNCKLFVSFIGFSQREHTHTLEYK